MKKKFLLHIGSHWDYPQRQDLSSTGPYDRHHPNGLQSARAQEKITPHMKFDAEFGLGLQPGLRELHMHP